MHTHYYFLLRLPRAMIEMLNYAAISADAVS